MKKSTSTIMLILICIMIISYAIATFALQYFAQVEISPTLTTAWFSFWGVEIVSLAAIKTSKVKHKYEEWKQLQNSVDEEDTTEE